MYNFEEKPKAAAPKIYSKNAIMGFCVFFAPIFGGILLRQNLIDIGNKPAANFILMLSVFLSLLTVLIVNSLPIEPSAIALLINLGWAFLLTEYFYKKFFSEDMYEYKKIWKALIVSFIIIIPLVYIILNGTGI